MSLKSFHIIFIIISSLFMVYFSYWSFVNWFHYKELSYIFYGILSSHKEKADKGGFFIKLIHIIISLFLIVAFIGSAAYLLS